MPFDSQTKARMFIRSSRLCCLCLKQCGVNIEAAHIVDEAKGGSNEEENGIPVCFDCHQEIGAYDAGHPKGNKFTPNELIARRDRIYKLVDSGVIYAQIVAANARRTATTGQAINLPESAPEIKPSEEALRLIKLLLEQGELYDAPSRKLRILSSADRAYVIDELVKFSSDKETSLQVLSRLIADGEIGDSEKQIILEILLRKVTLFGNLENKKELIRNFNEATLQGTSSVLRAALFDDLLQIVKRDQYKEVNELVPVLVEHVADIPVDLYSSYVLTLLNQSLSDSNRGAPAAARALKQLPPDMAKAALSEINGEYLYLRGREKPVRNFIEQYRGLADDNMRVLFDDLFALSYIDFSKKYYPYTD